MTGLPAVGGAGWGAALNAYLSEQRATGAPDTAAYPIIAYGNSYTLLPGSGYTSGLHYLEQAATALEAGTPTTYGQSGGRIVDLAGSIINESPLAGGRTPVAGSKWPGASSRPGLVVIDSALNDAGHYASNAAQTPVAITTANTRYLDGMKSAYRAALAVLSSESRVEQGTGTFSGTWNNQAFVGAYASGGSLAYTTTAAAYKEWTTITPPQSGPLAGKVFVLIYKHDVSVANMAQITTTIDGGSSANYTPNTWEQYAGVSSVNVNLVPDVIALTLPTDGAAHTVRVAHSGTTGQWMYVDCVLVPSETPNPVAVMAPPEAVSSGSYFTAPQAAVYKSNVPMVNPVLRTAVAEFSNAFWVPSHVSTNGLKSGDGIHPNDRGMAQRKADLILAMPDELRARFASRKLETTADAAFTTL